MVYQIPVGLMDKKKTKSERARFKKEQANQSPTELTFLYSMPHRRKADILQGISDRNKEVASRKATERSNEIINEISGNLVGFGTPVPAQISRTGTTIPFSETLIQGSITLTPNNIGSASQQSGTINYPYQPSTTSPNTTPYTTSPQQVYQQQPLQQISSPGYLYQQPMIPNTAPYQNPQYIENTDPWESWTRGESQTAASPTTRFLNPDGFRGRLVAYAVYNEPGFDNPKEGILFVRMCGKWKLLDPATFCTIASGSEGSWDSIKQYFSIKNYIVNNEIEKVKHMELDRFADLEIVSAEEAEA